MFSSPLCIAVIYAITELETDLIVSYRATVLVGRITSLARLSVRPSAVRPSVCLPLYAPHSRTKKAPKNQNQY